MNTELKNSIDYITEKTGKRSGFTIPTNYFDDVEDNFYGKLSEVNLPKEQSFLVPDAYFNSLEDKILAKVSSSKKDKKVISIRSRIAQFASIAAAASVLLFIGIHYFSIDKTENLNFDTLATTEVENWFDYTINNINSDDLALVLETSDFEENEFLSNSINDDILEEYLNAIETPSLLNEIN